MPNMPGTRPDDGRNCHQQKPTCVGQPVPIVTAVLPNKRGESANFVNKRTNVYIISLCFSSCLLTNCNLCSPTGQLITCQDHPRSLFGPRNGHVTSTQHRNTMQASSQVLCHTCKYFPRVHSKFSDEEFQIHCKFLIWFRNELILQTITN